MKYYVGFRVDARYIAEVEADSLEEALSKAENDICDVDFGEAEDIDCDAIWVDDENANQIWEG